MAKSQAQQAQGLRQLANQQYGRGDFLGACQGYTQALASVDQMQSPDSTLICALLSNRAAANMKLSRWSEVLKDAQAALSIQPDNVKAQFRSASALVELSLAAPSELREKLLLRAYLQLSTQARTAPLEVKQLLERVNELRAAHAAHAAHAPSSGAGTRVHTVTNPACIPTLDPALIPVELRQGHVYQPSVDGVSTNLLVLLHGLGDSPAPYAALAMRLALPQTAYLVLPGPLSVPETQGGRAWFEAHDEETWEEIQPTPGEHRRTQSLGHSVDLVCTLLASLAGAGLWGPRACHLLGFSQGATAALHIHARHRGLQRLGGCVAVSGALLEEWLPQLEGEFTSTTQGCVGPTLLTHGDKDDVLSHAAMKRSLAVLVRLTEGQALGAQLVTVPGKGHTMMGPAQQEVQAVMAFWARTLRAAAPEGAEEVTCE